MELGQIIALVIIGALAGTAVASLFSRGKRVGGTLLRNTVIGVLGAIVGGFLFDVLKINTEGGILGASLSLGQFLTAFVGAIVVVFVVSFMGK